MKFWVPDQARDDNYFMPMQSIKLPRIPFHCHPGESRDPVLIFADKSCRNDRSELVTVFGLSFNTVVVEFRDVEQITLENCIIFGRFCKTKPLLK